MAEFKTVYTKDAAFRKPLLRFSVVLGLTSKQQQDLTYGFPSFPYSS